MLMLDLQPCPDLGICLVSDVFPGRTHSWDGSFSNEKSDMELPQLPLLLEIRNLEVNMFPGNW